jgi:hypothetical protein
VQSGNPHLSDEVSARILAGGKSWEYYYHRFPDGRISVYED